LALGVVLDLLGGFLIIAACSRRESLLKVASLGMFRIDPDSPAGRRQRAILFTIGAVLMAVALALITIARLDYVGVL
jgi:hypothetical protein